MRRTRDALALSALAVLGACSDGTGPGSAKATISGIVTVADNVPAASAAAGVAASASDAVPGRLPSLRTVRFTLPSHAFAEAPDQLIVTFRPADVGAPPIGARALAAPDAVRNITAAIRSRLATHALAGRAEIAGVSPTIVAARIRVRAHARLAEVAAELRSDPAIAVVEPNRLARLDADEAAMSVPGAIAPGDFLYPVQAWHYGMLDLPRAWAITTGSPSVLVAVVDDGIRFDHPDIAANLTADGYDFVSQNPIPLCGSTASVDNAGDGDGYDPDPTIPASYGHGTSTTGADCATSPDQVGGHGLMVAGIIGAVGNNGTGVAGVNWAVRIRPVRVGGVTGMGTAYDLAQGILYAAGLPADNGAGGTVQAGSAARVINVSFGGPQPSDVEQNAVAAAISVGALVVASAGNSATSEPHYPADYPGVISVSAVGPGGTLASYSNFGPKIAIAAPGGDIAADPSFGVASTGWDFQNSAPAYLVGIGTSFAAPHVSGVAALLLAHDPTLSRDALRSRLTAYAVDAGAPGRDDLYGAGIVNARNSLTRSFAPAQRTYVQLYDAALGAVVRTVAAQSNGSFAFTAVSDGRYYVFAGQDESGDGVIGVPGRRWGALGEAALPTEVVVSGPATYTASFSIGPPMEIEPNDVATDANVLSVGGYVSAQVATPGSPDFFRVRVPTSGQYTFETSAWAGACGFALEENTILTLHDAGGNLMASSDDIDASALNFCSRLTRSLTSGTYYLSVDGHFGRRYRLSARAGG